MEQISFCDHSGVMSAFYIIKTAVAVIQIGAPILLIIMCMIDVAKLVASADVDTKKAFSISKNRIIAAALIFLIPAIIDMTIINVSDIKSYTLTDCYMKSTKENIELTKISEAAKRKAEENEIKKDQGIISIDGLKAPVNTANTSGDLIKFVMGWEGNEGYCDAAKTQYRAKNIGDGTVTAGYGITNHNTNWAKANGYGQYFPMKVGGCYPVDVIDAIFVKVVESHRTHVVKIAQGLGINLTSYQIDALTSYEYNYGGSVTSPILKRYASEGNAGVLSYMKAKLKVKWPGWNPRRDAEYTLFVEGFYDTKYYGRKCKYITGGSCK